MYRLVYFLFFLTAAPLALAAPDSPVAPRLPVGVIADEALHKQAIVIDTQADSTARIAKPGAAR